MGKPKQIEKGRMRKLRTVAYEIFGPKSLLQKVEISNDDGDEDLSNMLEEEEEMVEYTARRNREEISKRMKAKKAEKLRKLKEMEAEDAQN